VYCFDTDVISATLWRDPPLRLIRRLAVVPAKEQHTTAINLGEMLSGVARVSRPDLADRVRAAVTEGMIVLPFDAEAAAVYGWLRVELERKGQPLDDADLRIAATVLAANLILVTGNTRHFDRVPGLRVENWLAEPEPPDGPC
jgi:tRNA(fMet)-specific endonuclease VapC